MAHLKFCSIVADIPVIREVRGSYYVYLPNKCSLTMLDTFMISTPNACYPPSVGLPMKRVVTSVPFDMISNRHDLDINRKTPT